MFYILAGSMDPPKLTGAITYESEIGQLGTLIHEPILLKCYIVA